VSPAQRILGAITAICGLALLGLPFATWYVARLPSGEEAASGIQAAGELWLVPPLGALVVVAGVAIALGRAPLLAGTVAACAGALAAAIAAASIAWVPVSAVLDDPAGAVPVDAGVDVQSAAPLTAVAGGLALLSAGIVALWGWLAT